MTTPDNSVGGISAANNQRLIEAIIRTEGLGKDISDIKVSMRDMATAITKLAIFEERQVNDRAELGRVSKTLEIHDQRIDRLEIAQPVNNLVSGWVQKAVWLVMTAVIVALLALVVVNRNDPALVPLHIAAPAR